MGKKKKQVVKNEDLQARLSTIKLGLEQLQLYKDAGCSPDANELDWDIKLYEWILAQPDASQKASDFLEERHGNGSWSRGKSPKSKRDVVKALGWNVP